MSDQEEEDDFASFGTPLEPIDEDALPRKKPLALEDQVVKDKQGRRRFHGAFTGGFSAGFFNSVGSLEGWQPTAFKSSRGTAKADKVSQRPEDFMDDEDMEEHGIAPQVLRTTSDFSEQRGIKRSRPVHSDGPIPGKPVLGELLQAANETVGIKLLKRMGWKPGQGVGPRLTKTEKKRTTRERQKSSTKVYGCALPDFTDPAANEDDATSSSDEDVDVTFAPDDYEPFLCKPKDNCFGIGYVGLDKRPVLSSHINLFEPSLLQMTDKNKKKVNITGQAFGVGAFEEEDSDIYARDDMTQYDFALESTSKSRPNRKKRWADAKDTQNLVKCLEGFHLADKSAVRKKHFPPPTLPRDYKPVHVTRKSRFDAGDVVVVDDNHSKKRGLERHALTADDRSHIIGDKPSRPTVVETHHTSPIVQSLPVVQTTPLNQTDLLGRFRPFVADPEKQQRYEKFLFLKKDDQKEGLTRLQPLSMLEWEREHERMEFEQAARLYRPMSGDMNDRFVSAKQADETTNPLATVERSRLDVDNDIIEAAKMKMFGRLTRERGEWRPTSLLCKRFNVPEPFGGSSTAGPSEPQKRTSKFSVFDFLDSAKHNSATVSKEEPMEEETLELISQIPLPNQSQKGVPDVASPDEPAKTNKEALQFPDLPEKVDLFKAIFLSSSEESESEEEAVIPQEFANIQRNTSPPRGIFANIDLDAINSHRQADEAEVEKNDVEKLVEVDVKPPTTINVLDPSPKEDAYGPSLPPSFQPRPQSPSEDSSESSEEERRSTGKWVEKSGRHKETKHKSKKSHKKSSKHKKHKSHKKKHKKK